MISERILTLLLKYTIQKQLVLEKEATSLYPGPKTGRVNMLYIHIPFCESLCPYCSFNRFLFQEQLARGYFFSLRQEMRLTAALGYQFSSLYIGGGTPTILVDELIKTIDLAKELFGVQEVSCETNPDHLTEEIVGRLRGRVHRLSIGVQSFNDSLLKQMQRFDKFGCGQDILRRIQGISRWFPSVNVDLIFNFPSQTLAMLQSDIELLKQSGATQVSYYPLMTAPSVARSLNSSIGKVDYTRESFYYETIEREMKDGFRPTTAWTYDQSDSPLIDEYIADHDQYVGLGSGSFSYLDGCLYVKSFSIQEYARSLRDGKIPVVGFRQFGLLDQMRYRFMMELFSLRLDRQRFRQDFGQAVDQALWKEITFFKVAGAFKKNNLEEITLSSTGRYLMVVMMREFFSGVDSIREQARLALGAEEQWLSTPSVSNESNKASHLQPGMSVLGDGMSD